MNKNVYNPKRQNASLNNNRGQFQKNNFQNVFFKNNKKKKSEKDKDFFNDNFKVMSKVNKSEKSYSRKGKNKFDSSTYDD